MDTRWLESSGGAGTYEVSISQTVAQQVIGYGQAIGSNVHSNRDYYIPWQRSPRRDALLLPFALQGTGFSDNRWNPGDDLYNAAIAAIGYTKEKAPDSTLRVTWRQGETDALAGWTQNQYAAAFDAMVTAFRAVFGANVPFILIGMRPGWIDADFATRNPVELALADTPNRLRLTAYVDPRTVPVIGDSGTFIHYTASEQRMFPPRIQTAFETL